MKFKIWDFKNKRMIVDGKYFIGMDGSTNCLMNGELVEFKEPHIILYSKEVTDYTGQDIFDGDIILFKSLYSKDKANVMTITSKDNNFTNWKMMKIGNAFETSQYDLEKNKITLGRNYGWDIGE